MSLTVKVQFRQKLFKFAPGVRTLQQVDAEMRQRFPGKTIELQYFYEGLPVEDLTKIIGQFERMGKNSIKLTAELASASRSAIRKDSLESISSSEQNISVMLEEEKKEIKKQERKVEVPSVPLFDMPREFYVCYNCEGKGVYVANGSSTLCEICSGKGEYDNTHKVVKHWKKLLALVNSQPAAEKKENKPAVVEQIKLEAPPSLFKSALKINKDYQVKIVSNTKFQKMQIGKPFTYKFNIKNTGKHWEGAIQIVDIDTKETTPIRTLYSGDDIQVELGPFVCDSERILEKGFFLAYRENGELVRFGYKFGFCMRGYKPAEPKKLLVDPRLTIRTLKQKSGSKKSEEYLMLKLESMGVSLSNIELGEELLLDLIRQIQ